MHILTNYKTIMIPMKR